jgi:hypothetical protein
MLFYIFCQIKSTFCKKIYATINFLLIKCFTTEGGERGQPSASVYGTPQIAGLPMHAPLPPAQRLPQAREVVEAALAAWAAQRTAGLTIQMPSGALSPPAHHPTAAATVAASSLGPRRRIGKCKLFDCWQENLNLAACQFPT